MRKDQYDRLVDAADYLDRVITFFGSDEKAKKHAPNAFEREAAERKNLKAIDEQLDTLHQEFRKLG